MTTLASDTFNRADAADLGAAWDSVPGDTDVFKIVGNTVQATDLTSDTTESNNSVTWPADQWSEIPLVSPSSAGVGTGYGVSCRCSITDLSFYRLIMSAAGFELGKFVAGAFTSIASGSGTTFANGDTGRLECQGSSLRMYKNGVQFGGTQTDSSIASGRAGIAYSSTENSTPRIDSWSGGDFAGGIVNTQTLSDAIAMTDSAPLFLRITRLLSDTLNLSDEAIASIISGGLFVKILSSALLMTDELRSQTFVTRRLEDFLAIDDAALTSMQRFRLLTDLLSLDDSATATFIGSGPQVPPKIVMGYDQPRFALGFNKGGTLVTLGIE